MTRKSIIFLFLSLLMLSVSSCLKDNEATDFSEWRKENEAYLANAEIETINGSLRYEKIVPEWDKSVYSLIQWHNDRSQSQSNLSPISNSTVDIKYTLTNISGDTLDRSSYLRCRPNNMITGFWLTLTNMVPGDTVTAIIPYTAGYGASGSGSVKPYSTLIFGVRLDSIVAYESLPWRQ